MIKGEASLFVSHETLLTMVQRWMDEAVSYRGKVDVTQVVPVPVEGQGYTDFKIGLRERPPEASKTSAQY